MSKNNDLKRLSIDLYHKRKTEFSENGEDALRRMFAEALGQEVGEPINYYKWEENKNKIFQILTVAVDAVMPTLLTNQFDNLCDVRNVAIGDVPRFEIQDNSLFRVGVISAGNQDLRRQEIFGTNFTVQTDWHGTAAYVEWERFMAGNVDWTTMVNRIALSTTNYIQERIYKAISTSYNQLEARHKANGTFDEDKLIELVQRVNIETGGKGVKVFGTLAGLRKVMKAMDATMFSGNMKDEINRTGYLGTVAGIDFVALPQVYKAGTKEFAINDNTLLVLPANEKIIAMVFEGASIMKEDKREDRTDMQMSFLHMQKFGLQVAKLAIYGMYQIA